MLGWLLSGAGVVVIFAGLLGVPAALGGAGQPDGENLDLVAVPLIFVAMVIGALLITRGRQWRILPAVESLRRDRRPPVLFLRSFDDDDLVDPTPRMIPLGAFFARTYEESLVGALNSVGPVVSIGRPTETLARLGSGRLFVPDHAWRTAVDHLRQCSAAVVVMVGRSDGVWWEITSCLDRVPRAALLFFFPYVEDAAKRRSWWRRLLAFHPAEVPLWSSPYRRMKREREARYALFRDRVGPLLAGKLPPTLGDSLFIDFLPDGSPRALKTVRPGWWPLALLTPSLRHMLANPAATLRPFVDKLGSLSGRIG